LCAALQKTKGSFYHHFRDMDEYLAALLARWEEELTESPIRATAHEHDPYRRGARLGRTPDTSRGALASGSVWLSARLAEKGMGLAFAFEPMVQDQFTAWALVWLTVIPLCPRHVLAARYTRSVTQPPNPLAGPRLWDLVAEGYSEEISPHLARYAIDALHLAEVGPGMLIADVACGPGALSLAAARLGARAWAIDFSPEMIARLREGALREGTTAVEARVGDGMALPLDDGTVDAVFSMFSLMFFADRAQGFRELWRILKVGGRAVVGSWVPVERVPVLADIYRALGGIVPDLPFGGAKRPLGDAAEIRTEMTEAGFRDVEVCEITHTLDSPSVDQLWTVLERSTPPIRAVREKVGPERWPEVVERLLDELHAKWGTGPQGVPMIANLASGRR
jgi:SAM-dependent methyltransferase